MGGAQHMGSEGPRLFRPRQRAQGGRRPVTAARAALLAAALAGASALDPNTLRQQLALQEAGSAGAAGFPGSSQPPPEWQVQGLAPPPPVDPSGPLLPEEEPPPAPLGPPPPEDDGGGGDGPPSPPRLALQAQSNGGKQPLGTLGENPLLSLYRQQTVQYEKDAEEASKAAAMYAQMTKDAVESGHVASEAASLGSAEMGRIGVGTWAHAAWAFEMMLRNKNNKKRAKAGAAAAKPFNVAAGKYLASQNAFDSAAQEYSDRVGEDESLSKQLQTYSNQYRLEGDDGTADAYENQAQQLMAQAKNFANIARDYYKTAMQTHQQYFAIKKMGKTAAKFAKWQAAKSAIPAQHLFPFTVVPPIEFVQTGDTHSEQAVEQEGGSAQRRAALRR